MTSKMVLEYVWVDGNDNLRTKIKIVDDISNIKINNIQKWNYDGSSTCQTGNIKNTEIILVPCKIYLNPFRRDNKSYIILCETYDIDGKPHQTNSRYFAKRIFDKNTMDKPWFGLEQEYFMLNVNNDIIKTPGLYYCGTMLGNIQRKIAEEHMDACIYAGVNISGINSEVSPYQWEFQIGPSVGIDAGDDLYMGRYILERIAEKYDVNISYEPKLNPNMNGSGCHCNFSTQKMRDKDGIQYIYDCIDKLERKHNDHILVYGKGNEKRLTGLHETSSYHKFSYGIGTRNTSIRIPNQTVSNNCGYFEDRRPAANIDPYKVTSIIYETCCL